jgi:hypothetical protein
LSFGLRGRAGVGHRAVPPLSARISSTSRRTISCQGEPYDNVSELTLNDQQ